MRAVGGSAAGLGQVGGEFTSGPAFCSKSSVQLFQPRPRGGQLATSVGGHLCLGRRHFLLLLGPPVYRWASQPHSGSPKGALDTLESVFLIQGFPNWC